jgi:hypothetical protein
MTNKRMVDKTERNFWLLVSAILVLAGALAVAWYVYVPDAPATEHGHIQR